MAGVVEAHSTDPAAGSASCCLLLVCGLPGCGKSSFCRALVAQAQGESEIFGFPAEWRHMCYDDVEMAMRPEDGSFDPGIWRESRSKIAKEIENTLESHASDSSKKLVLVLDDNMYYRSMRKQWYHIARERGCAYRQAFLQAPEDVCLERNSCRDGHARVPDFSIQHMAEVFQWPFQSGASWEAQDSTSMVLDAHTASTDEQVQSFLRHWREQPGSFWQPPRPEEAEDAEPEVQSDGHHCDVALRKIVARALAQIPKAVGKEKSVLAKQWGAKKADVANSVSHASAAGNGSVTELIQEAEVEFLQSCVADVQRLMAQQEQSGTT